MASTPYEKPTRAGLKLSKLLSRPARRAWRPVIAKASGAHIPSGKSSVKASAASSASQRTRERWSRSGRPWRWVSPTSLNFGVLSPRNVRERWKPWTHRRQSPKSTDVAEGCKSRVLRSCAQSGLRRRHPGGASVPWRDVARTVPSCRTGRRLWNVPRTGLCEVRTCATLRWIHQERAPRALCCTHGTVRWTVREIRRQAGRLLAKVAQRDVQEVLERQRWVLQFWISRWMQEIVGRV
mmetsp:Transcript_54470/g.145326  ORF Transcript_54470/g.145326 Transcript_54470/m.145326 type:complete len:238 (-) Transcript_54470:545-1258(-)